MDPWFREIYVLGVWRVHLASGSDFREKNRGFLGRSESEFAFSLVPCHFTMEER